MRIEKPPRQALRPKRLKGAPLLERSIQAQKRYLEEMGGLGDEALLYRLNLGQRGYIEQVEQLSSDIGPMKRGCRISVLMPALAEEMNIANTLSGWVRQMGIDGKLEPDLFEIIVLVNRPRPSLEWDSTLERVVDFAKRHPGYSIHALRHSFNFPETAMEENGTRIEKGIRMGLIFKLAADIALLRNIERGGLESADHLMHPSGADVYRRSRRFLEEVFGSFRNGTDFLRLKFVLPDEVCAHTPLLWALHEYRMAISYEYFGHDHLKRHGVFRSGAYAEVGGFNPDMGVGEDTEFGNRIRDSDARVSYSATPLVADNPRRSLATILGGKILVQGYQGFGTSDSDVRCFSISKFLSRDPPPEIEFTEENFAAHASGHFRHYVRKATRDSGSFSKGLERAGICLRNAMTAIGFGASDFSIVSGETPSRCSVRVETLANLRERLEGYEGL